MFALLPKVCLLAMFAMQSMAKTVPKALRNEIVAYEEWNCGASDFEKPLSYQMVKEDCPKRMFEADMCCRVHDMCYMEEHRSRDQCDEAFCYCLERTVAQNGNQTSCAAVSTSFCEIVKLFGGIAYSSSQDLKAKQDKAMANFEEEEKQRKAMASSTTTTKTTTSSSSTSTTSNTSEKTTTEPESSSSSDSESGTMQMATAEPTSSSSLDMEIGTTPKPMPKSSSNSASSSVRTTISPAEIGQFVTHKFPLECFDNTLSFCTHQLHQCVSEQYNRQNDVNKRSASSGGGEAALLIGIQMAECSAQFCACSAAESVRARLASVPRSLLGDEQCAQNMAHICAQFGDEPVKQYTGPTNVHYWSVSVNYNGFSANLGLIATTVVLFSVLLLLLVRLCSKVCFESIQKRLNQHQHMAHKNYTCRSSIRRETLTALRNVSGVAQHDSGPHYLPLGKESTVSCPASTATSSAASSPAGDEQCSVLDGQHLLCPHKQSPKNYKNSRQNSTTSSSSNKHHKKANSELNKQPLVLNSSQVHLISGNSSSTLSDVSSSCS